MARGPPAAVNGGQSAANRRCDKRRTVGHLYAFKLSLFKLSFMRLPPFKRHTFHMIRLHADLLGQVRGCIVAQLAAISIAASGTRPASHCSIWCLVARIAIALGGCLAMAWWDLAVSQLFALTLHKGKQRVFVTCACQDAGAVLGCGRSNVGKKKSGSEAKSSAFQSLQTLEGLMCKTNACTM